MHPELAYNTYAAACAIPEDMIDCTPPTWKFTVLYIGYKTKKHQACAYIAETTDSVAYQGWQA